MKGFVCNYFLINSVISAINCSSVTWHVTSSSIQGTVEGLFSKATATNGSKEILANPEGGNVSFTGLYPGANYSVSLVYERNSIFPQCDHVLTIRKFKMRFTSSAKCLSAFG